MKDVSVNIATKLKEKYEFSLIVNEKNIKQSKSRNIAISKSNSKYILCLDADDKIPNN
jgi:glycosyltransferase involved in cell wall biosynthesis